MLTFAAIGTQLRVHLGGAFSALNFFSYFTNLSNLFAASVLLMTAFTPASSGGRRDVMRYLSTVNMAIVGIVFSALLRNEDLGALLPWVNAMLHYVMPVAVVLDWMLHPPLLKPGARLPALTLIFPAAYLVYVLVRGASVGWYPYPFLNPLHVGGYAVVAAYSLGIAATFLLAGVLLLRTGRRTSWFRQR